ncbi:MAG: hypothetical protein KAJ33_06865 [Thermoplasmata archaeon]|nr:hypothetical protein [Thermoplasmata archaeon]
MSSDLEEDDDIFYGGGKPAKEMEEEEKKPAEESASLLSNDAYSHDYLKPAEETPDKSDLEEVSPAQEAEQEKDLEAEISHTRQEKMRAAEYHDVTILRQRAAKHSAEAAKLFKKYRAEEAAMVKYQENSNKARRKAEKYIEKSKDALAKADDKQADLEYLEGGKAERTRVKVAKLKAKTAKMKSKSSRWMSNSAKNTQKAAAKRQKAKALLERSKVHEAEALNYNKRANRLSKA